MWKRSFGSPSKIAVLVLYNEKIMQEFIRIQLYNSSIIQKMGTGNTVTSVSGK